MMMLSLLFLTILSNVSFAKDLDLYAGIWDDPGSRGEFYGGEWRPLLKDFREKRPWPPWGELRGVMRVDAYRGVTHNEFRFGAVEFLGGFRLTLFVTSQKFFRKPERRGGLHLDLLAGGKLPVSEWNDGLVFPESVFNPRLSLDLWEVRIRPEIKLSYRVEGSTVSRTDVEGRVVIFEKGPFQFKPGLWKSWEKREEKDSREWGPLLELKVLSKRGDFTLFGKMGKSPEHPKDVKSIFGVCLSF